MKSEESTWLLGGRIRSRALLLLSFYLVSFSVFTLFSICFLFSKTCAGNSKNNKKVIFAVSYTKQKTDLKYDNLATQESLVFDNSDFISPGKIQSCKCSSKVSKKQLSHLKRPRSSIYNVVLGDSLYNLIMWWRGIEWILDYSGNSWKYLVLFNFVFRILIHNRVQDPNIQCKARKPWAPEFATLFFPTLFFFLFYPFLHTLPPWWESMRQNKRRHNSERNW